MAFGQQSGPPATAKQVRELTELVLAAGHTDFRDARGPLGLTQRQAGGKFTRDEADQLIARLESEAETADGAGPGSSDEARPRPAGSSDRDDRRMAQRLAALRQVSDEDLAAELQRRGWAVIQPG